MASQKYINTSADKNKVNEVHAHNWSVMKPFVQFGVGAIKILAHTFIFIAKGALKLIPEKQEEKSNKVVKP